MMKMIKLMEKIKQKFAQHPLRKLIGVIFVAAGFFSIVTPFTPWGILFFVGLELLGIRFLFLEKIKEWAKVWFAKIRYTSGAMSFLSQLNWRYATKKFDGSKVSDVQLEKILEAIRLAPSSYGLQPFHVTVVSDVKLQSAIQAASWDQEQMSTASHVLVFSARTDIHERIQAHLANTAGGKAEVREKLKGFEEILVDFAKGMDEAALIQWAANQAYIALGFGLAACAELGVDSCPMEGFEGPKVKEILALPENFHPQVILTIGTRAAGEAARVAGRPKVRFSKDELFDFKK